MSTHFLPVFAENAVYLLERRVAALGTARLDRENALAIAGDYRILGICHLLRWAVPDRCLDSFHRGGRAYLSWLRRAAYAEQETGNGWPFFDAVAAGDGAAATEIARLARADHHPGREYEDDFLYIHFLMSLFYLSVDEDRCQQILDRYEQVLDGADDFRFEISMGLLDRDSARFEEGLRLLLEHHEAYFLKMNEMMPPEKLETEGKICVEGLALVLLAEKRGLAVQDDYLFVPSTLRQRVTIDYADDNWRNPPPDWK